MTNEEFSRQFALFQQQSVADGRFAVVEPSHPILDDDKSAHDEKDFSLDYFLHTSWAARKVAKFNPRVHFDFGSYVYFAGLVSAFVMEFFYCDIRGIPEAFPKFHSQREDLTRISFADNSIGSISSLHVIEHCGLGRYGDTLDAQGDLKAARELTRILAPGGQLLMVLPMNEKPCVRFNGERMYSYQQVWNLFGGLAMRECSFIYEGQIKERNGTWPPSGDYTGCMVFTKEKAVSA